MMGSELLKQIKDGDKTAVNELYAKYSDRIYRFAFGYLKSEEDTLDLIQDVFIRFWNSRKNLKGDTNLEAFLFTIARNSVISTFRKKIVEKEYLEHLRHFTVHQQLKYRKPGRVQPAVGAGETAGQPTSRTKEAGFSFKQTRRLFK